MKPSDIIRTMQAISKAKPPVLLSGPPGVGKSQMCRQLASLLEGKFLDVRLIYHDPSDLKFPIADVQKRMIYWVNSLFPQDREWRGIICLEELAQCPQLMHAAAMQITLDRRCGDYILPDGAWVVACSNRQEDRAGCHRMITPLLNRFVHLDVEVDHKDWNMWAMENGIIPEVRGYLNFKPTSLMTFDPKLNERAFGTPRSWEMVSNVHPLVSFDLETQVTEGIVGTVAHEYIGFARNYRDLPDPDGVIANPEKAMIPKEPSIAIALCTALADRAKDASEKQLRGIMQYADRLPDEYSCLLVRDAAFVNSEITCINEAAAWMKKHRDILYPAGGYIGGKN